MGERQYLGPGTRQINSMKLSGKIYLVEFFESAVNYRDGTVISLSPQVSYQLGLRGIPYKILEEFYSESNLRLQETDHFHSQLAWIHEWDQFLQSKISFLREHRLSLARLYYNRIKYFVDPVIIQFYILDQVLSNLHPESEIIYVRQIPRKAPRTMHEFKFSQNASCFADLFPKICAKHKLVRFRFLETSTYEKTANTHPFKKGKGFWQDFKLHVSNALKPILFFFKFRRNLFVTRKTPHLSTGVLFLHSGSHHLDPVIRTFLAENLSTFLVADKKIYTLNKLSTRISLEKHNEAEKIVEIREQAKAAAQELSKSPYLFNWIKERTKFDLSDYLIPFFQAFLEDTASEILNWTIRLDAFFRSNSISYVVTHTSSDVMSKAAILACKISSTKSICIQHGCDVFDDPVWLMTDLDPFDYYLSTDSLSKQKFSNAALRPFIHPCKVLESPHYLSRLKGIHSFKSSRKAKKILYIPTKLSMHGRYFNCMIYPVLWYFEYQKELIKWMASQTDKQFIFKQGRMIRKYAEESIIPFIDDLNASNIQVENGPTTEYFSSVDAVIMDRPSTAFFEATTAGLPVLCLYASLTESMIHPDQRKFFGPSLQPFSNAQEAIQRLTTFLDSADLTQYTHDVPLVSDFIAHKIATGHLV